LEGPAEVASALPEHLKLFVPTQELLRLGWRYLRQDYSDPWICLLARTLHFRGQASPLLLRSLALPELLVEQCDLLLGRALRPLLRQLLGALRPMLLRRPSLAAILCHCVSLYFGHVRIFSLPPLSQLRTLLLRSPQDLIQKPCE